MWVWQWGNAKSAHIILGDTIQLPTGHNCFHMITAQLIVCYIRME